MNPPVNKTGKYVSGDFFSHVRWKAAQRGIDFLVTIDYLDYIMERQDHKCVYTGDRLDAKTRRQYTASLDRIDSSVGYVEGNVQFVKTSCNFAKHSLSEEDFLCLVEKIYKHKIGAA